MSPVQWVLAGLLALAAGVLAVAGLAQRRRRVGLARLAEQLGLRFAVRDFMGLPRRYRECLLMQAGHSAYAQNILFGRLSGCSLRAFDYRVEAGHGPRRQVCRLTVVAGEAPQSWPVTAVWRDVPAAAALLCVEPSGVHANGWQWAGDGPAGRALARAWPDGMGPVTLLTAGRFVLAACPGRLGGPRLAELLKAAAVWVEALDSTEA